VIRSRVAPIALAKPPTRRTAAASGPAA
jgi:hypothetical protein